MADVPAAAPPEPPAREDEADPARPGPGSTAEPEADWEAPPGPGGAEPVAALLGELARLREGEATEATNRARTEVIRKIGLLPGAAATQALERLLRDGSRPVEQLAAANVLWGRGQRARVEKIAAASGDRVLAAKVEALRARDGD